jgi:pyruvate, orthophosphate dikinase
MSPGDSDSFLGAYTESAMMKKNPFASINQTGVGQLVKIA